MNNAEALRALRARGLRPKKSFGQNFLSAAPLCDRIAELALPPATVDSAVVLEIGAGLGALTAALAPRAKRIIAVERDRDLMPILEQRFAATSNVQLLAADAVRLRWAPLLDVGDGPKIVCGNLPYQLTGRLLRKATALAPTLQRVVVMVQREVADRLRAQPHAKAYSAMTIFVQAAFSVKRALKVSAAAFTPAPRVDSAVLVLTPHTIARAQETPLFQQVVKAAFSQRRKRLSNSLKRLAAKPALQRAATAAEVELGDRAEALSVEQFDALARALAREG
ncbi:MAG TPA: ribosomal RNA small subunit methyltransferase A [Sorangium sp.]|nr:ribosomal RNA small subunit methyltransferase A [Sorangium sp.]